MRQKRVNHKKPSWSISLGFTTLTKFYDAKAFEWLKQWMVPQEWRHLYAFDFWKWSIVVIRRNR